MFLKWTKKEKEIQLLKRGRYAELICVRSWNKIWIKQWW